MCGYSAISLDDYDVVRLLRWVGTVAMLVTLAITLLIALVISALAALVMTRPAMLVVALRLTLVVLWCVAQKRAIG